MGLTAPSLETERNVSADPENDFVADGLADELIVALSNLDSVRVVARTSAFSFKGTHRDVREIADTVGVDLVLEGSVRKSGARLRVTADLVNAASGCQIWSERYDREIEMRDMFEVQDELTRAASARGKNMHTCSQRQDSRSYERSTPASACGSWRRGPLLIDDYMDELAGC
jgi:TolB-like protein